MSNIFENKEDNTLQVDNIFETGLSADPDDILSTLSFEEAVSLFSNDPSMLNEAVRFGKTADCLEMERLIGEIRATLLNKSGKLIRGRMPTTATKTATDNLMRHLETMFNVETIHWFQTGGFCTMPFQHLINFKDGKTQPGYLSRVFGKQFKTTKTGVKFSHSEGKTILMGMSFDDFEMMNDAEVTSVIIHEMGHSFFEPLYNGIMLGPGRFIDTMIMKMVSAAFDNEKDREKYFRIIQLPGAILGALVRLPFQLLGAITGFRGTNLVTTSSEIVADQFAAAYGYGPEIVLALKKMTTFYGAGFYHKDANKSLGNRLFMARIELFQCVRTPHPTTMNRLANALLYLDKSRTGNPEIDAQIDEEIKVLKDFAKQVMDDGSDYALEQWIAKRAADSNGRKGFDIRNFMTLVRKGKHSVLSKFTESTGITYTGTDADIDALHEWLVDNNFGEV